MVFYEFLKRLGLMWYVMNPKDHLFETVSDVPDYYKEVTPAFIFVIIVEQAVRLFQGKKLMRLNDSITNICQGILVDLVRIPLYGTELILYTWLYSNFRICTLPWNSSWTWLLCLVLTDLLFYWMHRASHQISILWFFHEPHHSSEEFNLTVPLRLSIFTNASFWLTYLPMAFAIPPSVFFVHYQMNIILQYWLHTELISSLGVIEKVFVTPSLHRVHHGRNRRCIDKNFGSVFIIWDRLFGTYELEGDQKIAYGVTNPIRTFNSISIQANVLKNIWNRLCSVEGISNKLSVIVKGPGWKPGTSWLGDLRDVPEPKEDEPKYDPPLPKWLQHYIILHSAALVIGYLQLMLNVSKVSYFGMVVFGGYIAVTALALGYLMDLSPAGPAIEIVRAMQYFLLDSTLQRQFDVNEIPILYFSVCFFRMLFFGSFVFWIFASPFFQKIRLPKLE